MDLDIIKDGAVVFDVKFLKIDEVGEDFGFGETAELIWAAEDVF